MINHTIITLILFLVFGLTELNAQFVKSKILNPIFAGIDVRNGDAVITTGYSFFWHDNVIGPLRGFYTTDIFYGHGIYHGEKSFNLAISRTISLLQVRLVSNLNYDHLEKHAFALQPQLGMGVPGLFEFYMGYNLGVKEVGEMKYQNGMSFTFRLYLLPGAEAIGNNMRQTFRKGALQEYYFEVAKPSR